MFSCAVILILCVQVSVSDGGRWGSFDKLMCPRKHNPVCGSDGKTYWNECKLRVANGTSKANIFIVKHGECDHPKQPNCTSYSSKACTKIYKPVCGSDGKTYSNECELCAANKASKTTILIQKHGECKPHPQPNSTIMCPMIYSPVCGSDGKTYGNECMLRAANQTSETSISFMKQGKCDKARQPNTIMCSTIYSPVCGSDGKTYGNGCWLLVSNQISRSNISIVKQGECDHPQQPNCKSFSSKLCKKIYKPVCGSDGKTYSNECELCAVNKSSKTKILIQKHGECKPHQQPNSPIMCPMNYSPVCGSDGKTYGNECELRAANETSKITILIQKHGECDQPQKV